jgi:hypothetical protein
MDVAIRILHGAEVGPFFCAGHGEAQGSTRSDTRMYVLTDLFTCNCARRLRLQRSMNILPIWSDSGFIRYDSALRSPVLM